MKKDIFEAYVMAFFQNCIKKSTANNKVEVGVQVFKNLFKCVFHSGICILFVRPFNHR
jgi:hypothetical protein